MIYSITEAGYYHSADGIPNQDAVRSFAVAEGIVGLIVSDGCSTALWSGVCSTDLVGYVSYIFSTPVFLRRMERYLSDNTVTELQPDAALFNPRYSDALLSMLSQSLREFVERLSEKFKFLRKLYTHETNANDFSATMTLLFFQVHTGKIITLNVGDGFACVKSSNKLIYIAEPENNGSPSKTYFITGEKLREHLHLKRYQIKMFEFILISTDGLKKIYKDNDLDDHLMQIQVSPEITANAVRDMFLEDHLLPDDVGFILATNPYYNEEEQQ